MFSKGEKVVHIPEGVCSIEDICTLEIEKQKRVVYKLRPVVDGRRILYIPIDSDRIKLRALKSKEEIETLLKTEPAEKQFLSQNIQKRSRLQKQAIYEDNSELLIRLIKLYILKKERTHIALGDYNWLRKAEQYLFSEIAEVLGCEYKSLLPVSQCTLVSRQISS